MILLKKYFLFILLFLSHIICFSQQMPVYVQRSFDTSYVAVLNRARTLGYKLPSLDQQRTQNQLVLDLKSAGVWDKLDVFYMFANDAGSAFSTLNWKNPALHQSTLQGSITYEKNGGFSGGGTLNDYISTNFNPASSGVNYTQNNAGRFFWVDNRAGLAFDGGLLTDANSSENANSINQNINEPSQVLLLDAYPGAAAAYSLRALNSAYTGNCIQVRRSNNNALQNIGFAGGVLDTASLKTFCEGTDCFVTIWYDQSGNGLDVTQGTAGNQPQIVASGVVTRFNGQVGINFTTDDRLFRVGGIFSGAAARSIFTVYRPNVSTGSFSYNIFGQSGSTTTGTWSMIQARTMFVTGDPYFAGYSADIGNGLSSVTTLQKLASFIYNGTTGFLYRNSTLLGSANVTLAANLVTARITIGAGFTLGFEEHANAVIQECIAYASDQASNRSGIETNIKTFFGL